MKHRPAVAVAPHVPVGVLGGRSLVGRFLIPRLVQRGHPVVASSRGSEPADRADLNPRWCRPGGPLPSGFEPVRTWIAVCPIWATAELLGWLESCGLERLVALSSTSVVTKEGSRDPAERQLARRLAEAEAAVLERTVDRGITATVLRPTMIYDGQTDGNVSAIAACVRRFGRFPLCGAGSGLRQPVHADDVAQACVTAAFHPEPRPLYAVSGRDRLSFRELVERTCHGRGLPPRTLKLPTWIWRLLAAVARGTGLAPGLSLAVGPRMNEDLVFDHAAARDDLGFNPRGFTVGGHSQADAGIPNPAPTRAP